MLHLRPRCGIDAEGARSPGFFCVVFFLWLGVLPVSGFALERGQADMIPHVNQQGRDGFLEYLYAEDNKAFAIAPGGAWAWSALQTSEAEARRVALQSCQSHTQQACVLYAVNDKLVFDRQAWSRLWRLNKQQRPATTVAGVSRGSRFPNLAFKNAKGKSHRLSNFKGKLILVHFWGSWCPPCMREMPSLLRLQQALKKNHGNQIKMVLLQVREPFSRSLQWAKQQQFDRLPLYDSGVKGDSDSTFYTADGQTLKDRQLARAFPTSYVLDRQGRVLFAHTGPITDWLEYLPFFKDIVELSRG